MKEFTITYKDSTSGLDHVIGPMSLLVMACSDNQWGLEECEFEEITTMFRGETLDLGDLVIKRVDKGDEG